MKKSLSVKIESLLPPPNATCKIVSPVSTAITNTYQLIPIVSVKDSTVLKRFIMTNVGQFIPQRHNNQIQTCYCALLQDFMKHGMVIELNKRNI